MYLCISWIIYCLIFIDAQCKYENLSCDLRDFSVMTLSITQLDEKHQRKLNLF